jgi:asparagine synthase (glutamine-hydrolysing)
MSPGNDGGDGLHGADPATVRRALDDRDPLPGTTGFAGRLDGRLVRDVLGRVPLYTEGKRRSSESDSGAGAWSHDPTDLGEPVPFPAGHAGAAGAADGTGAERVWRLPDPAPHSGRAAVRAVRAALDEALDATRSDGLAVAFSGGVDSALLAARLEGPLYVAGFPDSADVAAARESARLLGREADLRVVELDHGLLEHTVERVVAATGRTNPMDVSIAVPLLLVARRAAADGYDRLAVGQGADELFGGYAKVARAPDDPRVAADTVRGARREVLGGLPDQLPRDWLALRAAGVEPAVPLLHDRVVAAALVLDGDMLVRRGERKWALRLAAREWLPDRIAFREKRAVQYGSDVADELDRLARQSGFKRRMDDHLGRYIDSLVE